MMTDPFKLFISVDMEGITAVVNWSDVDGEKKGDYEYFRRVMTEEVNAVAETAFENGASDVLIRDAHGSAMNLLPSNLDKRVKFVREWAGTPFSMMEGLDDSFDAVAFIGYHAKAGSPNATLKHTFSGRIRDFRINSISMAEASINALIAGYFHVPVIFLSGDRAICEHISGLIDGIECVPVKEGFGTACISLHPEKSKELIRSGMKRAVEKHATIQPFKLKPPYKMEIVFSEERFASKNEWYPRARRMDNYTIQLKSNDLLDCFRFLMFGDPW